MNTILEWLPVGIGLGAGLWTSTIMVGLLAALITGVTHAD